MTTIATDGKSMAGDGQAESHDMVVVTQRQKVRRLSDGAILGCSGEAPDRVAFTAWIEGGERPKIKQPFSALILRADGTLEQYDASLIALPVEAPMAIGSGCHLAVGAMDAGATPGVAVTIAVARDPHSGGTVTALHLQPALDAVA